MAELDCSSRGERREGEERGREKGEGKRKVWLTCGVRRLTCGVHRQNHLEN